MSVLRKNVKSASVFLMILMLSNTIPYQSAFAAMIGTEATLDSMQVNHARAGINDLLSREDVQSGLIGQGTNPIEAKARIDSLTDAEVMWLADQIDNLPAGGGSIQVLPTWAGIAIIAAVVLIIVGLMYLANLATSD